MNLVNILSYLPSKLSVLVYLIPAEMKDAYMSLEGRRDEAVDSFDNRRLKEAQVCIHSYGRSRSSVEVRYSKA